MAHRSSAATLVLLLAGTIGTAAAHPGQSIGLTIAIDEGAVEYDMLVSADFAAALLLNHRITVRMPSYDGGRYHFADRGDERRIRAAFEQIFLDINPVTIDGERVRPVLADLAFIEPAPSGYPGAAYLQPPDIRIVLRHETRGIPKTVAMVWEVFPQDPMRQAFGMSPNVEVVAELDALDENRLIVLSEDEPEFTWHAPLTKPVERVGPVLAAAPATRPQLPLLSVMLVVGWGLALVTLFTTRAWPAARRPAAWLSVVPLGAAFALQGVWVQPLPWSQAGTAPQPDAAADIFAALHRNVYRAFDYKTESDVYDVLAQSVTGDLLDRVYNEVFQSLILRDQGGAVARIRAVEILDSEVVSTGVAADAGLLMFQVAARWRVQGAVYHWGHVHQRTNEYHAVYSVIEQGNAWKITGVDMREQRRIVMEGDDPVLGPSRDTGGAS